ALRAHPHLVAHPSTGRGVNAVPHRSRAGTSAPTAHARRLLTSIGPFDPEHADSIPRGTTHRAKYRLIRFTTRVWRGSPVAAAHPLGAVASAGVLGDPGARALADVQDAVLGPGELTRQHPLGQPLVPGIGVHPQRPEQPLHAQAGLA